MSETDIQSYSILTRTINDLKEKQSEAEKTYEEKIKQGSLYTSPDDIQVLAKEILNRKEQIEYLEKKIKDIIYYTQEEIEEKRNKHNEEKEIEDDIECEDIEEEEIEEIEEFQEIQQNNSLVVYKPHPILNSIINFLNKITNHLEKKIEKLDEKEAKKMEEKNFSNEYQEI